jgi:hypothetical protein
MEKEIELSNNLIKKKDQLGEGLKELMLSIILVVKNLMIMGFGWQVNLRMNLKLHKVQLIVEKMIV